MGKRRILLDTRKVTQLDPTVKQRFWPAGKSSGPVLACNKPWERHGLSHGTVLQDHDLFKAWYNCEPDVPPKGNAYYVAYAESKDGVHWQKPDLDILPFRGSRPTNLLNIVRHRPSVMVDDNDPDPAQRYKANGYVGESEDPTLTELGIRRPGRGYYRAHSADGLHWTEYPAAGPMGTMYDVGNFISDEPRRRYLGAVKQHIRYDLLDRRSVGITTSTDFGTWSPPQTALVADALDDRIAREKGYNHAEFYGMGFAPYEDFIVGFVWIFWVSLPLLPSRTMRAGWWGNIDVHLVWSYDGSYWLRPPERQPFIPLGVNGDFDAGQIQTLGRATLTNDRVLIYYTGNNKGHAYFDPLTAQHTMEARKDVNWDDPLMEHTRAIGLATIKRDRYSSLSTGTQGSFTVVHGAPDGTRLLVNARAPLGSVKAQVLDGDGNPIPGFGVEQCRPFSGDSIDGEITWAGTSLADLPSGRPISFRFVLDFADVFAYQLI